MKPTPQTVVTLDAGLVILPLSTPLTNSASTRGQKTHRRSATTPGLQAHPAPAPCNPGASLVVPVVAQGLDVFIQLLLTGFRQGQELWRLQQRQQIGDAAFAARDGRGRGRRRLCHFRQWLQDRHEHGRGPTVSAVPPSSPPPWPPRCWPAR
jgi:hypothetical protein